MFFSKFPNKLNILKFYTIGALLLQFQISKKPFIYSYQVYKMISKRNRKSEEWLKD